MSSYQRPCETRLPIRRIIGILGREDGEYDQRACAQGVRCCQDSTCDTVVSLRTAHR